MELKNRKRSTGSIRRGNGDLITLGQFNELRSKLKEEFGVAVDTLEVPVSSKTWTSITQLGYLVGGYSVSFQINLEKARPKRS